MGRCGTVKEALSRFARFVRFLLFLVFYDRPKFVAGIRKSVGLLREGRYNELRTKFASFLRVTPPLLAPTKTTAYSVDSGNVSDLLLPLRRTRLEMSPSHIVIKAFDDDPAVVTRELTLDDRQKYLLVISASFPRPTVTQVYWHRRDNGCSEEDAWQREVAAGTYLIQLSVPEPSSIFRIRFDPGRHPGEYALHRFSIITPGRGPRHVPQIQLLAASGAFFVEEDPYKAWLAVNELNERSLSHLITRLRQHEHLTPKISIVVPIYKTPMHFLERMIQSVRTQVYENWELCLADDFSQDPAIEKCLLAAAESDNRIKVVFLHSNSGISEATNTAASMATGEFLAFLDHDDELTRDALAEVALYLAEHAETDYLYTDDDKVDQNGNRYGPQFKPDWSPELLLSSMYCCHLIVIRRSLFQALGGMRKECDGSQDYDLALRATEKARSIAHLPLILYHWRASSGSTALSPAAKEYTSRAAEKALADALRRRNIQAKPALHKWASDAGVWRFALSFPDTGPSVTLLIPTKYRVEVLRRCLESLKKTSYLNYDVLVIDNESENPEMLEYLHTLNCRVARIGNNGPSFNFSHVNNVAARLVDSEYILFLNDDTEVLAPHWLSSMMGYAQIEGVGAVGARLLYPDGRIQHAGIVNGVRGGLPDHAFKLQRGDFKGRLDLARLTRNVSGVTAACLLTKRSLFLQLGGFDELNFPRAFQDPDYCLKLIAKGYRIVYCSEAELVHHESTSRPKDLDSEEHKRYAQKYWMFKDPYYSPHFSLDAPPAMQIRPQRWATSSIPFMRAAIVLPNASSRVLSILLFHVLSELRRQHVIDPFILAHEQCEMRDAYQASGYRLRVSDRAFVADEDRAVRSRVQHELKNIIDNEGIELIWAFGIENIDALLMARHQAIPAIWTLQDSAPQELERMASDEIRRLSEILYIPYRVVFNSWETKELFRSWGYSLNADVVPLVAPRLSEFELHEWHADEKGKDESFQGANWDSLDIAVHRYAEIVGEAYYTKGIARSHDFSRNRIGFQGARSGITVKIYQLFFHSEQIRDLDPHFIPHDGCENPHPHHYETYWFTKLWSRQWHKKADYTGFLSPKFGLKTCLEGYQFRKFIEDNPGHDVYFVNPFPHETYLFFNVWDHGEACHPGLVALAQDLFDRVEPGIQIHYLGRNDISTALFCNYWVGNALFWDEFMAFVKPLYEFIVKEMDNEDRARFFSPVPYVREAPAFPFIFERLFSTFLLLRRDIRACAYRLSAEEISRIYSQSVDPSHWKKVEPMVALIDAWDEKRDPEGDTKQQREEFLTLWTQGVPLSA